MKSSCVDHRGVPAFTVLRLQPRVGNSGMLARSPYLPSTWDNQVDDELTTGGVNTTHSTGGFVYRNLESTSYWQVNLGGLKHNGAVGTTPHVIIDSGISFLAGPTTDVESVASPLSPSSTTIFSSQEYTVDCSATCNVAYTVGGVDYELTEKDLVISFSGGTFSSD